MKKYKNKKTGAIISSTEDEMLQNYGKDWQLAWELVPSETYVSKAKRGVTALDKLTGTWTIKQVTTSKGGPNGINPILVIDQSGVIKRCYVHPSELPNTEESADGVEFTWTFPSLTNSSSVTINNGSVAFSW